MGAWRVLGSARYGAQTAIDAGVGSPVFWDKKYHETHGIAPVLVSSCISPYNLSCDNGALAVATWAHDRGSLCGRCVGNVLKHRRWSMSDAWLPPGKESPG